MIQVLLVSYRFIKMDVYHFCIKTVNSIQVFEQIGLCDLFKKGDHSKQIGAGNKGLIHISL